MELNDRNLNLKTLKFYDMGTIIKRYFGLFEMKDMLL